MFSVGHPLNIFSVVSNRCYADDMQLYISVKPNNLDSLFYLTDCFTDITNWMSLNWPGNLNKEVNPLCSSIKPSAKNLGITYQFNFIKFTFIYTVQNHNNGFPQGAVYCKVGPTIIQILTSYYFWWTFGFLFLKLYNIHCNFLSFCLDYCNSVLQPFLSVS